MKSLVQLSCIAVAALSLTACANRQPPQQAVWNATPGATVPQEQAKAKCDYEIMQNRAAYDNLSLMAGTPMLSEAGRTLYKTCMLAQGYRFGGMVPAPGAAP